MKKLQKRFLSLILAVMMGCFGSMVAFAAETSESYGVAENTSNETGVSAQEDTHTIWAPGVMQYNGKTISSAKVIGGQPVYYVGATHNTSISFTFMNRKTFKSYYANNISTNGEIDIRQLFGSLPDGNYMISISMTNADGGCYSIELVQ